MKITMELSENEIKDLQNAAGFLVRDEEEAKDAIRLVLEKANQIKVKDAKDFREAIIEIANYMAFATKETVSFNEPIEVEWGLKGTCNHDGMRMVIPVVALVDKTKP